MHHANQHTSQQAGLSRLASEITALEWETFEIADYADVIDLSSVSPSCNCSCSATSTVSA
jgi:thiazolylpeptide-type bacteriocin precursor